MGQHLKAEGRADRAAEPLGKETWYQPAHYVPTNICLEGAHTNVSCSFGFMMNRHLSAERLSGSSISLIRTNPILSRQTAANHIGECSIRGVAGTPRQEEAATLRFLSIRLTASADLTIQWSNLIEDRTCARLWSIQRRRSNPGPFAGRCQFHEASEVEGHHETVIAADHRHPRAGNLRGFQSIPMIATPDISHPRYRSPDGVLFVKDGTSRSVLSRKIRIGHA